MNLKSLSLAGVSLIIAISLFLFFRDVEVDPNNNVLPAGKLNSPGPLDSGSELQKADDTFQAPDEAGTAGESSTAPDNQISSIASLFPNYEDVPKLSYEDDWCIANMDLTSEDIVRSKLETNEFLFSRGAAEIATVPEMQAIADTALLNNEYVESYQELVWDELSTLAESGDRLAMITLMQRLDFGEKRKRAVANQLLVLGDTRESLKFLVGDQLSLATKTYLENGEVNDRVKSHLQSALALVEYGIERSDFSAFATYFAYLQANMHRENALVADEVLSEDDFYVVAEYKRFYKHKIDAKRFEQSLPLLDEEQIPHVARKEFESKLAYYLSENDGLFSSSMVLKLWSERYHFRNDCVNRQMALNAEINAVIDLIKQKSNAATAQ